MKHLKIFILSNLFLFLLSCGTVKEGFSNQKKNNSDEFLVEKKTPLVMPPNYNELPEPKINQQEIEEEQNSIKSLLLQEDDTLNDNEIDDKDKKLEESLLEKIKKN
jgi:flagellar basal body-associated protein FliL